MSAAGVDFGTTNCVVATFSGGEVAVAPVDHPPVEWAREGFDLVLPSVFALDEQRQPLFGWDAKQRRDGKIEAVKRLFASEDRVEVGAETFFVEEVAALLFGHLNRAAAIDLRRAVVTVPANSRGLARHRTKICAGMAGIEVQALVNEPTAAAMAHGLRAAGDRNVLVVDWGGGTLDVTLLEAVDGVFMEQASKGIQRLGGLDFDRRIYEKLIEDLPTAATWSPVEQAVARLEIELAKVRLSSRDEVTVALPGGTQKSLTRRRLADWLAPLVERAAEPIRTCLDDLRMTPLDVDEVVLVGGTCKMPAVRDFLAGVLGKEPSRSDIDPMTAVAEGAALASAILAGEHDADYFVSTEHALGTVTANTRNELEFSVLIPRNHKLPAQAADTFVPVVDYQEAVQLRVIEGDPSHPLEHEDNVILRTWEIPIDPPRPRKDAVFSLIYDYDANGILHVRMLDAATDVELFSSDVSYADGRDPRSLVAMANRVDGILTQTEERGPTTEALPPHAQELADKARNLVIPFVPEDEAERLNGLVSALEAAKDEQALANAAQELTDALRRYSYLL